MSEKNSPTNAENLAQKAEKVNKGLDRIFDRSWDFVKDLIDLKDGLDKEGTIINIKNNKKMKGANAWLLMCSIFIASLGLDLNSPAVIIGAMLISPLMAPILGIGLAVGINDRNTLIISGQHLIIAIVIALLSSTIYFLITGVLGLGGGFTDEIRGRTSPNVLDAMVALIGGFAGIISSSRKDKSNAIPGVAIATALMPPLCVTGYGVANLLRYGMREGSLNFGSIMFNSFFLFFLNATLVALATYLIVRFMDFPRRTFDTFKEELKTKRVLYFISALLLGISVYTSNRIIQENRAKESINTFVDDHFKYVKTEDCFIQKNIDDSYDVTVTVFTTISEEDSIRYNTMLKSTPYNITNANLTFIDLPKLDEKKLISEAQRSGVEQFKSQMALEERRKYTLDSMQNEIDLLKFKNKKDIEQKLSNVVKPAFPNVEEINFYESDDLPNKPHALSVKWNRAIARTKKTKAEKEKRLNEMVVQLMDLDTLIIVNN